MEDYIDQNNSAEKAVKESRLKTFFFDLIKGFCMGVAFIIPGFSGGSVAAILGIYEKLIGAITGIFRDFKKSFSVLLPIILGMGIGIISLLFPLGYALEKFPLPTVCLFVGLALGGLPSITDEVKGNYKTRYIGAFFIPFALAFILTFMPIGKDVNLIGLSFGGYLLLFIIGVLGSAALVVPGISGSMLLLILGYYNPIINIITKHLLKGQDILESFLVLLSAGAGVIVGFFVISLIMKYLLKRFRVGTFFAIIGFILGSIPTIYSSVAKDANLTLQTLPTSFLHWFMCVFLLALGIALSLGLVIYSKKHNKE